MEYSSLCYHFLRLFCPLSALFDTGFFHHYFCPISSIHSYQSFSLLAIISLLCLTFSFYLLLGTSISSRFLAPLPFHPLNSRCSIVVPLRFLLPEASCRCSCFRFNFSPFLLSTPNHLISPLSDGRQKKSLWLVTAHGITTQKCVKSRFKDNN